MAFIIRELTIKIKMPQFYPRTSFSKQKLEEICATARSLCRHRKSEGKVHPKDMLISDERSDKIGKNAVDCFSISLLVLKIFAFKVEKLLIWRPPS